MGPELPMSKLTIMKLAAKDLYEKSVISPACRPQVPAWYGICPRSLTRFTTHRFLDAGGDGQVTTAFLYGSARRSFSRLEFMLRNPVQSHTTAVVADRRGGNR